MLRLKLNHESKIGSKEWSSICVTWGHLNKKDGLTRYGDSHVKDKTS